MSEDPGDARQPAAGQVSSAYLQAWLPQRMLLPPLYWGRS